MAKRGSGGEGHEDHFCCGPRRSFFWGVVAGVVLCLAVCNLWCGKRCGHGGCMHGMSGCTYGEKAPEGKTGTSK